MQTPASIRKHPIHPMLITLPIGLWLFSFVCDLVRVFGGTDPAWEVVARYTMAGGIVGALIAAVPGTIDMLSLSGRPRRIALMHMAINLAVVALYIVNLWLRLRQPSEMLVWLSLASIALLGASGWLGGKMVYEHAVGVDTRGNSEAR
ncbi:DUF2231 domain-containing protein [Cupriavidus sp. AU9028]|uniref:DUF2231 domain-containing protein n=1 Tax=Cupriavidus sp. AU9028 TaxID=2871157 RepID=UPI001C98C042|nr:DUF2231 domain-containing protein [Cupriavidus sp. AU9028]MBY4899105.1 DUF2231 domain-containing protein [Cupriavidus sp. AU9028]